MKRTLLFVLGLATGAITAHLIHRRSENEEIKALEAWAEALAEEPEEDSCSVFASMTDWDGEDPLSESLLVQINIDVQVSDKPDKLADGVVQHIRGMAQQDRPVAARMF